MTPDLPTDLPLVSVVIPTYNRSAYLQEALQSAVSQTYPHLEIIVSDDCSPDDPRELVEAFQDPRIRFRRNPTNLGVSRNMATAFREAKGKYIASLNDDDRWHPEFLAQLVPPLEANPNLVLSFCDFAVMDAESQVDPIATENNVRQFKRDRLRQGVYQPFYDLALIDQAVYPALASVIRNQDLAWDELPESGPAWDHYLAYLACRTGQGAYYHNQKLAYYRVHSQSELMLSGSRSIPAKIRKGKAGRYCFSQFAQDERLKPFQAYFWQEWAHATTTLGIGLLRSGEVEEARPYLLQALRQQVLNPRTLIALALSYVPVNLARPFLFMPNNGLLSRVR